VTGDGKFARGLEGQLLWSINFREDDIVKHSGRERQ
jgi:hypothetical protein